MHMLIDGSEIDSSDGGLIEIANPATGQVIDTVPEATPSHFETAITAAREGARTWSGTPVHERVAVLRRFVSQLDADAERLAAMITAENGKPLQQARDEIAGCVRLFRGYAEEALRLYGVTVPGDAQPGLEDDLIMVNREPFGVLGAIVPFNFPLDLFTHKVAPALATGNAVIVKPAEVAPLAVLEATRLLLEAGVPGTVMQTITGTGRRVGSWLAGSADIDLVSFTGSTDVGTEIAVSAARNLNPTFLELGGNDPLIVFPDADIDSAITHAVQSRTLCNGQTCSATKRLIVHRDVVGDLVSALVDRLGAMQIGNPMDAATQIGPLINEAAAERAAKHVTTALEQGADLSLGDGTASAAFFAPVVLTGVDRNADIARDTEVFAPTLPVIEFSGDDDAVAVANQSRYGLNASVFTADLGRGLRVARSLKSGTVIINGGTAYRPDAIPFGGYKSSGLGREGFMTTLQEFTQPKTISIRSLY
jgi:acyl-CoA reductase-like NAD-dependent aldehyde dehydrogenase